MWALVGLGLLGPGCTDVRYGTGRAAVDAADEGEPEEPAQPDDVPADAIPCQTHADCPDEQLCDGPAGCDARWFCQTENPCSAAAPRFYCGCDGEVFNGNAGCPGRRHAGTVEANPPPIDGLRCDPDNPQAFRFDLTLEGEGFATFEGLVVYARLNDPVVGAVIAEESRFIERGAFRFHWPDAFDPDLFGAFIDYYIDLEGSRTCEPGMEPSWRAFASNDFDRDKAHIVVEVTPDDALAPEICTGW